MQLEDIQTPELYEAMDWLLARQKRIENKLAKKHLREGTLVLYDVSSSYYTGRQSELIKMGYNRDGKPGEPQIVYGLLCASDGCPVAIEVFSGNTADPDHLYRPSQQDSQAIRYLAGRAGRRSRHDHQQADRRRSA